MSRVRRAACGRADMLRAFGSLSASPSRATADPDEPPREDEKFIASLCFFARPEPASTAALVTESTSDDSPPPGEDIDATETTAELDNPAETLTDEREPPKPRLRFLLPVALTLQDEEAHQARMTMPPEIEAATPIPDEEFLLGDDDVPIPPLRPWSRLWPFLRVALSHDRPSRRPDLDRAVRDLSRGRVLHRLPRRPRRAWHPRVKILIDRRLDLALFWSDYEDLERRLKRLRGTQGMQVVEVHVDARQPLGFTEETEKDRRAFSPSRPLSVAPDSIVLALGDLGQLREGTGGTEAWLRLGRRLRARSVPAWALCPAPRDRWRPALAQVWRLACWDRCGSLPLDGHGQCARPNPDTRAIRTAQVSRLAQRLAPAIRIEPGLTRAVRFLLSGQEANAGTEYDFWQGERTAGQGLACALRPEYHRQAREEFARLSREEIVDVVRLLLKHHAYSAGVYGGFERFGLRQVLGEAQWQHLVELELFETRTLEEETLHYSRLVRTAMEKPESIPLAAFHRRDRDRLPGKALANPVLQALWALDPQSNPELPAYIHPDAISWLEEIGASRKLWLSLYADGISVSGYVSAPAPRAQEARLLVSSGSDTLYVEQGQSRRFSLTGAAGLDSHFSHEDPVRLTTDRESHLLLPIHRPKWASRMGVDHFGTWAEFTVGAVVVKLRWIPPGRFGMGDELVETVVEHGFWMADTPCTQALWMEAMGKNPSSFEGELRRPVERVSWTDCSAFFGALGRRVSGVDFGFPTEVQWEYACRAGTESEFNNGRDAELEDLGWFGENSDGKTHPVGLKQPNAWGLYDMHGNVWEWCADWHNADRVARVVRGGSWIYSAWGCRSACRIWINPGARNQSLGFRLLAGQKQDQGPEAKGSGPSGARGTSPASGALAESVIRLWSADAVLPGQAERRPAWVPEWATDWGADSFGRWAAVAVDGVAFRFRWVAAGSFWMGSSEDDPSGFDDERPRHRVTLTHGFWLGEAPTTQAQWVAVMGENPSDFKGEDRPVEQVSWEDCQTLIGRLNEQLGLDADLPTEAEWEYACRAGTESAFNNGRDDGLEDVGWFGDNSVDKTHPVKLKQANAWGLYDMHGNVWEWCQDGKRSYTSKSVVDPVGPTREGVARVVRGGSWYYSARGCRSASRGWYFPGFRHQDQGFRLLAGRKQEQEQVKVPEAQS